MKLAPTLSVDVQLIMTGRGCIIGQSGSGKSFLVGTIAAELSKLNLPFCIIDAEGEYSPLKESFKAIVVGGENSDVGFDTDLSKLFSDSIKENIPVLLDISEEIDKTIRVNEALRKIYELEDKLRMPYLILIEETDKFAPQIVSQKINTVEEIAVRGRKRGIGLIVATQRPSNISKTLLSQCSYGFIGKLTIGNDLKAIQQLFEDKKKLKEIVKLQMGEFVPFGIGQSNKFKVKTDYATRRGSTPVVYLSPTKGSKRDLENAINKLKLESNVQKPSNQKSGKRISALAIQFSNHDAHGYAIKVAKKQFGIFGKTVEQPESIKLKYIGAALCKIRMPTKKRHEFEEYTFMIDNDFRLIKISKGIHFQKDSLPKPIKLNENDSKLLNEIRKRKKIAISGVGKLKLGDAKETAAAMKRLIANKLVRVDEKNVHAENYDSYLLRENPQIVTVNVPNDQVEESRITKEKVKGYVNILYPMAELASLSAVYIPIHEIVLRHKNRVRIFRIDGIFGKEIAIAQQRPIR